MTKAEREHRKKVLAAALAFYALGNRNASTLKRVVRAGALGILASGGDAEKVALAIYLVTRNAAARIRGGARARARAAWAKTTGLEAEAISTEHGDLAHAERAAQGMHKAFSRKHRKRIAEGETGRDAVIGAVDDLDSNFETTGVTETFQAANDETIALGTRAAGMGYVVTETWEAILDGGTCTECKDLDGKQVVRPARFPEDPPIHVRCRCVLSTEVESAFAEGAA